MLWVEAIIFLISANDQLRSPEVIKLRRFRYDIQAAQDTFPGWQVYWQP